MWVVKLSPIIKCIFLPQRTWLGGTWNTFPLVREEPLRCLNCIGITGCDGWSTDRRRRGRRKRLPCRLFDRDFILLSDLWEPEEAAEYLSGNKMFLYFNWNVFPRYSRGTILLRTRAPVKLNNSLVVIIWQESVELSTDCHWPLLATLYIFVYVHPIKPESQFNLETFSSPSESDRNQWPN